VSLQFLADGLIAGATIGLGAVGITLTYSVLRFANFAQGEFITWGCYLTWLLAAAAGAWIPASADALGPLSVGFNVIAAAVAAMLLTGVMAVALDAVLFGPLRRRAAAASRAGAPSAATPGAVAPSASISAVIASFGAAMTLRALIEALVPARQAYLSTELQIAIPLIGGVRLTPDQMLLLALAVVLAAALQLLLTRTSVGRSMRAVSENPELARVVGIDVTQVIRVTWFIGAALASAAGVMLGLVVQIRPSMGAELLLPLFAAAILGGVGSVPGALIGGLVVGIAEAAAVQMAGAQWRAAVAFLVVIAVLLVRPAGLFGRAA
jgi:branched-chain amino acid transport system permease protein